jgi:hypothetical protein
MKTPGMESKTSILVVVFLLICTQTLTEVSPRMASHPGIARAMLLLETGIKVQ